MVRFNKQQLLENDINNHKINNTPKSTQKQEHENFFKKMLLKKCITFELKNLDLLCLYTNLE